MTIQYSSLFGDLALEYFNEVSNMNQREDSIFSGQSPRPTGDSAAAAQRQGQRRGTGNEEDRLQQQRGDDGQTQQQAQSKDQQRRWRDSGNWRRRSRHEDGQRGAVTAEVGEGDLHHEERMASRTTVITRKIVTHFICLEMRHPTLNQTMLNVQNAIVSSFNLPDRARVNVTDDLHVTLLVLNLQNQEEERRVLDTLEATKHVGPAHRVLFGADSIGRFRDQVIWARPQFADLDDRDRLEAWRLLLFERLKDFVKDGSRSWTPHATIIKTKAVPPPKPELTEEMVELGVKVLLETSGIQQAMVETTRVSLFNCLKNPDGTYIRVGHVDLYDGVHTVHHPAPSSGSAE